MKSSPSDARPSFAYHPREAGASAATNGLGNNIYRTVYDATQLQEFRIHPKHDTVVTARNGAEYFFPAGCFRDTSLRPARDSVTVRLVETHSPADLVRQRLDARLKQTPLAVLSACFIEAYTDDGEFLEINPQAPVRVKLPVAPGKDKPQLFMASEGSDGMPMWAPAMERYPRGGKLKTTFVKKPKLNDAYAAAPPQRTASFLAYERYYSLAPYMNHAHSAFYGLLRQCADDVRPSDGVRELPIHKTAEIDQLEPRRDAAEMFGHSSYRLEDHVYTTDAALAAEAEELFGKKAAQRKVEHPLFHADKKLRVYDLTGLMPQVDDARHIANRYALFMGSALPLSDLTAEARRLVAEQKSWAHYHDEGELYKATFGGDKQGKLEVFRFQNEVYFHRRTLRQFMPQYPTQAKAEFAQYIQQPAFAEKLLNLQYVKATSLLAPLERLVEGADQDAVLRRAPKNVSVQKLDKVSAKLALLKGAPDVTPQYYAEYFWMNDKFYVSEAFVQQLLSRLPEMDRKYFKEYRFGQILSRFHKVYSDPQLAHKGRTYLDLTSAVPEEIELRDRAAWNDEYYSYVADSMYYENGRFAHQYDKRKAFEEADSHYRDLLDKMPELVSAEDSTIRFMTAALSGSGWYCIAKPVAENLYSFCGRVEGVGADEPVLVHLIEPGIGTHLTTVAYSGYYHFSYPLGRTFTVVAYNEHAFQKRTFTLKGDEECLKPVALRAQKSEQIERSLASL